MKKYIVVAFTLKGQDVNFILESLHEVAKRLQGAKVRLLHGFMPRAEVLNKHLPTDIVDKLEELFPDQINFFKGGKPLRETMAEVASLTEAEVFVIGEVKEGVAEEVKLYEKHKLALNYLAPEKVAPVNTAPVAEPSAGTGTGPATA